MDKILQTLKNLWNNKPALVAIAIVIILLILLMIRQHKITIQEESLRENSKTITKLETDIKTTTSNYMVLKNNFKEHCVTTFEISGRKVIDCKRESETNQNAHSQSYTETQVNQIRDEAVNRALDKYKKEMTGMGSFSIGPMVVTRTAVPGESNDLAIGGQMKMTAFQLGSIGLSPSAGLAKSPRTGAVYGIVSVLGDIYY